MEDELVDVLRRLDTGLREIVRVLERIAVAVEELRKE